MPKELKMIIERMEKDRAKLSFKYYERSEDTPMDEILKLLDNYITLLKLL